MSWVKKGLLLAAPRHLGWLTTHAALPVAEPVDAHRIRIYFSGRDEQNRSHPGSVELDLGGDPTVLAASHEPLLPLGEPGTFDDAGVMPSWVTTHAGVKYLYYVGWNLGVSVPFRYAIGLAVSLDGGRTFVKQSAGPLLDRSIHDPCFAASPCVLVDDALWRMWYVSCVEWQRVDGKLRHRYHIKYAESADGVSWRRDGTVSIDFQGPHEYALSRPCVIKDRDRYRMWFSHRGPSYRMGYAESADGIRWNRRDDQAGIDVSPSGWDSEMICYPFVFDHHGRRYLLYNGNGYGRDGIGYALGLPAGPAASAPPSVPL